uniref:Uncharacterized protein n=1 Tax=Cyanothece sp. (strain PCC 7425 / ATCC 29141) TaxID=395961 RepID=B8HKQ4_CYAP4
MTLKQPAPPSPLQKILLERQQKLGWSNYRLAVEYGKLFHPELPPRTLASRYQTTINQVLANPDTCYFVTVQNVLRAMQGSLYAQFTDIQAIPLD